MVPFLIYFSYMTLWALVIRQAMGSSDFAIIAGGMVLPFMGIIVTILIWGLRPPNGFLGMPIKETRHAPISLVSLGATLSGGAVFYYVLQPQMSFIELFLVGIAALVGAYLVVYSHKNKAEAEINL